VKTRLTTQTGQYPVFSSDGSQVMFASSPAAGVGALYKKPSNGATPEEMVVPPEPGINSYTRDWSLDGRWLVFVKQLGVSRDIWRLDLKGDRKPSKYLVTPYEKNQASLSPNSRWLAYVSRETDSAEVIVRPFPDPSQGRWKIAAGTSPRWKRDGTELYYLDSESRLIAVSVTTDQSTFAIGKSTTLFKTSLSSENREVSLYDVSPDGQHFLVAEPLDPSALRPMPLVVVQNWPSLLKR
jgi:Tol biopolymer transport system component